jgi:hypothetical protein
MSDNVFGLNEPQIKGTGDPDTGTFTFYRSIWDKITFVDPQTYEGISPIDGHRNFGWLGDYSEFGIICRAHKWASGVEGLTTVAAIQKLRTYHGKVVQFRPHVDGETDGDGLGEWMQNSSDEKVNYFCTVIPFYLDKTTFTKNKVECLVILKSVDYTDITKIIYVPAIP